MIVTATKERNELNMQCKALTSKVKHLEDYTKSLENELATKDSVHSFPNIHYPTFLTNALTYRWCRL